MTRARLGASCGDPPNDKRRSKSFGSSKSIFLPRGMSSEHIEPGQIPAIDYRMRINGLPFPAISPTIAAAGVRCCLSNFITSFNFLRGTQSSNPPLV